MCDEWMQSLILKIGFDEFLALPRNNSYKYEYLDGHAHLSPNPKFYHALLDLETFAAGPPSEADPHIRLRPLVKEDWETMVPLFAASFERQQPFGGLGRDVRCEAARQALERTRTGGDGPLIDSASFVAQEEGSGNDVGAILVTLLPDADPSEWNSFHWNQAPPFDCVERGLGRPHLTWIFVHPFCAGRGAGTALLIGTARRLSALGYHQLASTFLPTNESSAMWHWRNGFRLVEYAGSIRRIERQVRESFKRNALE